MSMTTAEKRLREIAKILTSHKDACISVDWKGDKMYELLHLCRLPEGTRTVRGWMESPLYPDKRPSRIYADKQPWTDTPVQITYTPKARKKK